MTPWLSHTIASKHKMPGKKKMEFHLGQIPFLELPLPPRAAKGMHQPAHTSGSLGRVHASL